MTDIEKQGDQTPENLSLDALAPLINIEHRAFIGSARKTLEHGIRAGELLAQAKSQCQHGTWLPWLEKNFIGAPRTAQSYMQLYKNRDAVLAKAQDSAHLSIDAALKGLAAPKESETGEARPERAVTLEEMEAGAEEALSQARTAALGIAESLDAIHRGRGWVHAGYASFEDYVSGEFATREPFPIPYAVISDEAGEPLPVFAMAESIHAWGMARTMAPILED